MPNVWHKQSPLPGSSASEEPIRMDVSAGYRGGCSRTCAVVDDGHSAPMAKTSVANMRALAMLLENQQRY